MKDDSILSALIGLVGACGSNPKTEQTDSILLEALAAPVLSPALDEPGIHRLVDRVHRERDAISPGCAQCKAPCGNTSDYDMARLYGAEPEVRQAKERVISAVHALAARVYIGEAPEVDVRIFYRALTYVGCDMEAAPLLALLEEIPS